MYFLVIVTYNRIPWIQMNNRYQLIIDQMQLLKSKVNLRFKAWAILPDHIHWLIQPGKNDYSRIVSDFKRRINWKLKSEKFINHGDKIWQARFWEETIKDEEHYLKCVEYIHYNPVKHGVCISPKDWKYSSFHSYVKNGKYPANWSDGTDIIINNSAFD